MRYIKVLLKSDVFTIVILFEKLVNARKFRTMCLA